MAFVDLNGGVRLNYELEGSAASPVLVLSNPLGTDLGIWDQQMPALVPNFRVLRYDTRGHGQSSVPPGPYTVEQLGSDVVGLMDALGIGRAHFCGLSLGGVTGIWLGANRGERLLSLALCNTAAKIGTAENWNARIDTVLREGVQAVIPAVLERWFTAGCRARDPQSVARVAAMLEHTPGEGYAACCAAVRDMDQRRQLDAIEARTLVVVGSHDTSVPPEDGRAMARAIARSWLVELPSAHLSNVELAPQFNDTLLRFLQGKL